MSKICLPKNDTSQLYDVAKSSFTGVRRVEGGDGKIDEADTLFWLRDTADQLAKISDSPSGFQMSMTPKARCEMMKFEIEFKQGKLKGKPRDQIIGILKKRVLPHKPVLTGSGYETFIEKYVDYKLKQPR
jgi:hypothetical protein